MAKSLCWAERIVRTGTYCVVVTHPYPNKIEIPEGTGLDSIIACPEEKFKPATKPWVLQ